MWEECVANNTKQLKLSFVQYFERCNNCNMILLIACYNVELLQTN